MADTRYIPFDQEDRFPKTHNLGCFLKIQNPKECVKDIMNVANYLKKKDEIVGIITTHYENSNQLCIVSSELK
jgi:hypothetical protein